MLKNQLIMICETLWFIATGITINWGQIVGGRLALVVAIHETSVDVKLTPYFSTRTSFPPRPDAIR